MALPEALVPYLRLRIGLVACQGHGVGSLLSSKALRGMLIRAPSDPLERRNRLQKGREAVLEVHTTDMQMSTHFMCDEACQVHGRPAIPLLHIALYIGASSCTYGPLYADLLARPSTPHAQEKQGPWSLPSSKWGFYIALPALKET